MNLIRAPLNWIKKWWSSNFYTRYCTGDRPLLDKLRCVKVNLKVNPYDDKFIKIKISPLRNNIVDYVEELKNINISEKDVILKVDKISNKFDEIMFYEWFRNKDGSIVNNDIELWNEFIDQSIDLVNYYNFAINNENGSISYNARLLQSHIINIEYIIDSIINQCKTD